MSSAPSAVDDLNPRDRIPLVQCRAVCRDFVQGKSVVQALRGVDLDVAAGELTLLVGPSGCGKSTLLSIVAGMLQSTSGEVSVLGQALSELSSTEMTLFRSRHIGFVFQQYNLLPSLTAVENVAVPLVIHGIDWPEAMDRASKCLSRVNLAGQLDAMPSTLSGGQQQRVAIARAQVHDPELIVCDEPTAALDAETGHLVMTQLRESALQSERAVLVVTHDPRVFPFGDRLAFMEDGRITRVDAQVVDGASLTHIMGAEK